jgi:hypothetical protein
MLATTCSLFASAAVTFNISPDFNTRSLVNSSTVVRYSTLKFLNREKVAGESAVSVIVTVIVLELD